jgi:hypothetical protein
MTRRAGAAVKVSCGSEGKPLLYLTSPVLLEAADGFHQGGFNLGYPQRKLKEQLSRGVIHKTTQGSTILRYFVVICCFMKLTIVC